VTPSFSYRIEHCSNSSKFLVREKTRTRTYDTRTKFLYQDSRTSFLYKKLGSSAISIRTKFYSVRETWSHVIEMLRCYWLEVRFVFFTTFRCWLLLVVSSFFVFLAILLIRPMECYAEKKLKFEIVYRLCHLPCFSYEFLVQETWTVCHQLYNNNNNNNSPLIQHDNRTLLHELT